MIRIETENGNFAYDEQLALEFTVEETSDGKFILFTSALRLLARSLPAILKNSKESGADVVVTLSE